MKASIWIMAAVLGAMAWSSVSAGERIWGDGTLPDYLAVFDVDGDGVLSVEEIQAMKNTRKERHSEWLARWDANGDGLIDEAERAAAKDALRDRIEEGRVDRFAEADTDGDGCLTFAEFSAIPAVAELAGENPDDPDLIARIYDRLDANDDACVNVAEFTARLREHRVAWRTPETYAAADVDADGCLTPAEFSAIPAIADPDREHPEDPALLFARLDADGSGCLSLEEFIAPVEPRRSGDWRTEATFAAADIDADGCLTAVEFGAIPQMAELAQGHPEQPAMIYSQLDADQNDCLTLAEFTAPCEPSPRPEPGDWRTETVFLAADADADGCLVLDEFMAIPAVVNIAQEHPEAPAMIYSQLDADQDACVSLVEFLAGHDGGPDGGGGHEDGPHFPREP